MIQDYIDNDLPIPQSPMTLNDIFWNWFHNVECFDMETEEITEAIKTKYFDTLETSTPIAIRDWRTFLTARNPIEEIGNSPISIHKSVTTGFIPPQKALALRLKFSTRHRKRCRRKFSPGSRAPVSHGLIYLLRNRHNLIAFRKQSSGIPQKCS